MSMERVLEDNPCIGSFGRGNPVDWKQSTRECSGCGRIFLFNDLTYVPNPGDYYEIPLHVQKKD